MLQHLLVDDHAALELYRRRGRAGVRVSGANAFTGARLDRAGDGRRRDPRGSRRSVAHPRRARGAGGRRGRRDGRRAARDRPARRRGRRRRPFLLGHRRRRPAVRGRRRRPPPGRRAPAAADRRRRCRAAAAPSARRPPTARARSALREAVAVLPQDEGGLVAYVASLLNWHRRHAFCAACGTPSDVAEGGLVRLCPRCGTTHHPRTDPVVIMLVDGRRPAAARPRAELAAAPLLGARRLRRAGGEPGGGGRPRGRRGERRAGRPAALHRLAAVAVPVLADARLHRAVGRGRAAPAGGRDPGRALVQPRRGRRRGRRRHRRLGRRPRPGGPGRDRRCCCRRASPSRGG